MLLAFPFEEPLATLAVGPPLQPIELLHGRFVDLLELVMRGGRLVQHAAQFGSPLECRQQESLALGEIVRKRVGVVHNDNRSNGSCRLKKTISGIIRDDATIPALPAAAAAQIEAAQ